jgi:alpha-tubulin suppressor-like RCC1 family protein/cation transport regulator ChaC
MTQGIIHGLNFRQQVVSSTLVQLLLLLLLHTFSVYSDGAFFIERNAFLKRNIATATMNVEKQSTIDYDEIEGAESPVVWDPIQQIYVDGKLPHNAAVQEMIVQNGGSLRIFGYGSLCWNPGAGSLAHESVTQKLGRARGYRRCWSQKSTDHRGNPAFPGIVCTLLKDDEFNPFRSASMNTDGSLVEGVIFHVPPDLVEECLLELDFREKGGYARDVIQAVEDDTGETVTALLYRGTPDNPAFWPRALKDLLYAAAVISVAVGPSGANNVYLKQLDDFLEHVADASTLTKFDDTFALGSMVKHLQEDYNLYFLIGCGSNQHNQLLLKSEDNAINLVNGEDSYELNEIVVCVKRQDDDDKLIKLFSGGGHSGLLTQSGKLYLFGWNDSGQLGSSNLDLNQGPLPVSTELSNICVEDAAFGFSHTLVIERGTNKLLCFGDNRKGQVNGRSGTHSIISEPVTPSFLRDVEVTCAAAGLFHSAVVTRSGELLTFGCGKFGQSLVQSSDGVPRRWRPSNAFLIKVACGRRHTVVLDDQGRVWTLGENKYGQIGRETNEAVWDATPALVHMPQDISICDVQCGWSHTIALGKKTNGKLVAVGWGRNDKGQLGTGIKVNIERPTLLFASLELQSIACGSESTIAIDADGKTLWSCGWNDHGNVGTGDSNDCYKLTKMKGAPLVTTPGYDTNTSSVYVAAGGAHVLIGIVNNR